MNLFKVEALWEIFQTTVFPYLIGRFSKRNANPSPTPGEGGQPEAPLKQQTTSVLKPRNDEAIQFAVDAALLKVPDGPQHIRNIQAVRQALEPHQQEDWRKNLGTHELTERFVDVMASETITRTNRGDPNQASVGQQPRGGQEKIERKFERRPLDYELTIDDPRVMHLILVSEVVRAEATLEQGVAQAKDYLLSAGMITRLSTAQQAAAVTKKTKDAAASGMYQSILGRQAKDEVQRREQVIEATQDDATRTRLKRELEAYTVAQSRIADANAKEKIFAAFARFLGFLAALFIIGLIIAASLKYSA